VVSTGVVWSSVGFVCKVQGFVWLSAWVCVHHVLSYLMASGQFGGFVWSSWGFVWSSAPIAFLVTHGHLVKWGVLCCFSNSPDMVDFT
jgi:hypothetical protein